MIDALIFSKNRPLQLHGLLSSLIKFTNLKPENISVLYKYDSPYIEGLNDIKNIYKSINFIEENNFELQVKNYLKIGQKFCVFFVDDILIKDHIDFNVPCGVLTDNPAILNFSLRLGTNLTFCYPVNSSQAVPDGNINSQMFIWNWKDSQYDWNYPFSVDGHVFRRSDLEGWSSHLSFKTPNQFESKLQEIPRTYNLPHISCCYLTSKLFNNPLNKVQSEFNNKSENISIDELFSIWKSNKEIDVNHFVDFLNRGAHHPVNLPIKERK
jgi:hypothetical protein